MNDRRITNTAKLDPISNLASAVFPGGIEHQEKEGQRELVNSCQLPTDLLGCTEADLESIGIMLGPIDKDADPLFRDARLPEGWKKVGTDHSMWSQLVDNKGRERAAIFYKAAFYDRSAHLRLNCRFRIGYLPHSSGSDGLFDFTVMDGGTELFRPDRAEGDDFGRIQQAACSAWLNERYPDWENKHAYWD